MNYLCKSKSSFLGDILENITLKYQYNDLKEKEKIETEKEIFLKKKAEMISALNVLQFVDREEYYSLHTQEASTIIDFLRYYRKFKRIITENKNFNKKNTGQFTVVNVLCIFKGFALIENFRYMQWRNKEHSTSRRNYFVIGFDNGFFAHPVSGACVSAILKEKEKEHPDPYKVWFRWMFGIEPSMDYLRQGDLLFIPAKRKIEKNIDIIEIGKHKISGIIEKNKNKFYASNFSCWHPHHNFIEDYTGKTYLIIPAKRHNIWNFSRAID